MLAVKLEVVCASIPVVVQCMCGRGHVTVEHYEKRYSCSSVTLLGYCLGNIHIRIQKQNAKYNMGVQNLER